MHRGLVAWLLIVAAVAAQALGNQAPDGRSAATFRCVDNTRFIRFGSTGLYLGNGSCKNGTCVTKTPPTEHPCPEGRDINLPVRLERPSRNAVRRSQFGRRGQGPPVEQASTEVKNEREENRATVIGDNNRRNLTDPVGDNNQRNLTNPVGRNNRGNLTNPVGDNNGGNLTVPVGGDISTAGEASEKVAAGREDAKAANSSASNSDEGAAEANVTSGNLSAPGEASEQVAPRSDDAKVANSASTSNGGKDKAKCH